MYGAVCVDCPKHAVQVVVGALNGYNFGERDEGKVVSHRVKRQRSVRCREPRSDDGRVVAQGGFFEEPCEGRVSVCDDDRVAVQGGYELHERVVVITLVMERGNCFCEAGEPLVIARETDEALTSVLQACSNDWFDTMLPARLKKEVQPVHIVSVCQRHGSDALGCGVGDKLFYVVGTVKEGVVGEQMQGDKGVMGHCGCAPSALAAMRQFLP